MYKIKLVGHMGVRMVCPNTRLTMCSADAGIGRRTKGFIVGRSRRPSHIR